MRTNTFSLVGEAIVTDVTAESTLQDNQSRRESPPSVSLISCGVCSGTGWELMEGRGVRPCNCKKERQRLKLISDARIPERYKNCALHNYEPKLGNVSQLRAINYAHRLLHDYPVEI